MRNRPLVVRETVTPLLEAKAAAAIAVLFKSVSKKKMYKCQEKEVNNTFPDWRVLNSSFIIILNQKI